LVAALLAYLGIVLVIIAAVMMGPPFLVAALAVETVAEDKKEIALFAGLILGCVLWLWIIKPHEDRIGRLMHVLWPFD
jgi:hypothetical protein